jgi:hypothetical protein
MTPWEREIVDALRSLGQSVEQTDTTGLFQFNGRMLNIAQLQDVLSTAAPTDGPTLRELLDRREGKP